MLYAIRTLFLDNGIHALMGPAAAKEVALAQDHFSQGTASGTSSIIDLGRAEAATLEALRASLRRVWATEPAAPDWFGKFTVWPLFMLGMSMHPGAEPDGTKDFECRSLLRLGHHMGSLAYKDAIWAMQHTWEQAERSEERSRWLGELPLDVLPGLFFM